MILLQILVESANGAAWASSKDLSSWLGIRGKSIDHVWEICINLNVLTPIDGNLYNAESWLKHNGFLGSTNNINPGRTEF